jgi:hypothetical protein
MVINSEIFANGVCCKRKSEGHTMRMCQWLSDEQTIRPPFTDNDYDGTKCNILLIRATFVNNELIYRSKYITSFLFFAFSTLFSIIIIHKLFS